MPIEPAKITRPNRVHLLLPAQPTIVQARTNAEGMFEFHDLAPGSSYRLSGKGASFRDKGDLSDRTIVIPEQVKELDLGDLALGSGWSISGRVIMKDASPEPDNLRLRISNPKDVNGHFVDVDQTGLFSITGLPAGNCQIRLAKARYRFSAENPNLTEAIKLEGILENNLSDFNILIESDPDWNGNQTRKDSGRILNHGLLRSARMPQ